MGEHEHELGAEQADAVGARFLEVGHVGEEPGIHVQRNAHAVARDRRNVAQRLVLLLALGAKPDLVGIGADDLRRGANMYLSRDTHRQ